MDKQNTFNDWYNRYYGNNDYGYRGGNDYGYSQPQQRRLSDLIYPQQSQMFSQPSSYQGQQNMQTYSRPLPSRYEVVTNGGTTKYMDEGTYGNYVNAIDSSEDPYDKMAAYRRLMNGL